MHRGYLKFWRMAEDSCVWSRGIEYRGLLVTLLTRANYKETSFLGDKIQPGQVAISMQRLADDLGISRDKLLRMVLVLKKDGVLRIENSHNRYTKITVVNFCKYQQLEDEHRTTSTTTSTTTAAQQPHTSKEGKNINTYSLREYCPEAELQDERQQPIAETKKAEVAPDCDYGGLMRLYNEILPELPRIKGISSTRRTHTQTRWRETWQRHREKNQLRTTADLLEWWKKYFTAVRASDFLMGRTGKWRADFDFLVSPKGYTKFLEGSYRNNEVVHS